MDEKILAAVLASLAAVFAGVNGGSFSTSDVPDAATGGQTTSAIQSMVPEVPFIDQVLEKPEPSTEVTAEIQIKDGSNLKLRRASVRAEKLTEIQSRNMKVNSDSDVTLENFGGKVKFGNTTRLKGSASGIHTSGVNVSTPINLKNEFQTATIQVENTYRVPLKFSKASIGPTSGSDFSLDTDNTNLRINSFSGDMTVYTGNRTILLDGKVDNLKAGKYSLQSQD